MHDPPWTTIGLLVGFLNPFSVYIYVKVARYAYLQATDRFEKEQFNREIGERKDGSD